MSDNTTLNAGSGGDVIATDDIGGVKHQLVKIEHGADGAASQVSTASPLPVQLRNSSGTEIGTSGAPVRVDPTGTTPQPVTLASAPLPTGAATEATLAALSAKVTACNTGAVVVAASALPTGAATAAKQPALGVAGTPSTDVLTVQGRTGMTPVKGQLVDSGGSNVATVSAAGALKVDGSAVTQPVSAAALPLPSGAATSANQTTELASLAAIQTSAALLDDAIAAQGASLGSTKGMMASGSVSTAAPSYTNGQINPLSMTPEGKLRVYQSDDIGISGGTIDTVVEVSAVNEVSPGVASNNLGKAAGSGTYASGHVGVGALAVRKDTQTALGASDGKYAPLQVDASGGLYVNLTTPLPAGTNSIGKLGPNSGVIIGDVNVVSFVPGTGATALGKAEDSAHSSGDTGVAILAKRTDTAAVSSGTDGDYSTVNVDSVGRLWSHVGAIDAGDNNIGNVDIVTLPGSVETDIAAIKTSAQLLDDAVFAEDVASSGGDKGMGILAIRKDVAASLVGSDGDYSHLQLDSAGALRVTGGGGGTQYAEDAALGSTPTGTLAMLRRDDALGTLTPVEDDAISARCNSRGAQWVVHDGAVTLGAGSASIGILGANSGVDIGDVTVNNGAGASAVMIQDGGNSITVDGSVSLSQAAQCVGDVAHDSADSGNPVKIGGKARTADVTAVATGDRVDSTFDILGKQVVLPFAIPDNTLNGNPSAITNTTPTQVIAAQAAGVRIYVTSLMVTNSHATTGTLVTITDGNGGSTLWQGYCAPVGGGFAITFPVPLRGSAATALYAVCGTSGANVYISANGYKAAA